METKYTNKYLSVEVNSLGEVFITNLDSGAQVRVSSKGGAFIIKTTSQVMTPTMNPIHLWLEPRY